MGFINPIYNLKVFDKELDVDLSKLAALGTPEWFSHSYLGQGEHPGNRVSYSNIGFKLYIMGGPEIIFEVSNTERGERTRDKVVAAVTLARATLYDAWKYFSKPATS